MPDGGSIKLNSGRAKYALYPVWLLSTSWQGKNYLFAMNGQTGKLVGDLPLDKGAFWRWLFGIGAVASVAASVLSVLYYYFLA